MKKYLSILAMAIIALSFSSCKKDVDADPPMVSFEQTVAEVAENATSALQVVLVADISVGVDYEVAFAVSGTATEDVNYEAINPKSVTMKAGEKQAVIFINPINETTIGENESLLLTITEGEAYTVVADKREINITILDNQFPPSDAPEVSFTTGTFVSNPYLEEELEITMGISKAVDTELLIGISFDEVLAEGTDYVVTGLSAGNKLVLPANATSASFTVSLKNSHAVGVNKTMQIGFAAPEVTDYAILATSNTVNILVTDPIVDQSAWFNTANEFNFFFASGNTLAYRTDLPAYRIKRYYWNSETQDWAIYTGAHYFYYAKNDQNQWQEVINIFHKQIGYGGVTIPEQERWEINAGNDFLGLTKFIANDATYMRNYVSSGDNGWIRFVTTNASSPEGKVIIPAQTMKVYKIKAGFDWTERTYTPDNSKFWLAWHTDSKVTSGKIWESTNVVAVEFAIQRAEGTYNTVTKTIEFEVVFTVSDPDFIMASNFYTKKEGNTYTMKIRYIPNA